MVVCPLMIVAFSMVAACGQTRYGEAARIVIKERGKKAARATLENTLWTLCRAIPVGAVRDRFMQGSKQWSAYVGICKIPYQSVLLGDMVIKVPRTMEIGPPE